MRELVVEVLVVRALVVGADVGVLVGELEGELVGELVGDLVGDDEGARVAGGLGLNITVTTTNGQPKSPSVYSARTGVDADVIKYPLASPFCCMLLKGERLVLESVKLPPSATAHAT